MGVELLLVAATVSRLANPKIHLAAYGGVVFPLSLLIEAPIIMILVASTALCKDWPAYRLMRNFILILGGSLTLFHIILAFSPLYEVVVKILLGAPESTWEPARLGLQMMTPWTMAIAVRRFFQGMVIRVGRTRLVGLGTLIRLGVSASVLLGGLVIQSVPGIIVATAALSTGVIAEAGFMFWCVRPIVRDLRQNEAVPENQLSLQRLCIFYWPLALTPLITLATLSIGSAAISRMPRALESLAVWPVLGGLTFMFRSVGIAVQEVVVTFSDRRHFLRPLQQFVWLVSLGSSATLLLIAATPLSTLWFESVAALSPDLSALASTALWMAVVLPALSPWESYFQGELVYRGATTYVTQAVSLYLLASSFVLVLGIFYGQITGLFVGVAATLTGISVQMWWLWTHSQNMRGASKDSCTD
jgi:progressive ankylosis protein